MRQSLTYLVIQKLRAHAKVCKTDPKKFKSLTLAEVKKLRDELIRKDPEDEVPPPKGSNGKGGKDEGPTGTNPDLIGPKPSHNSPEKRKREESPGRTTGPSKRR